MYYFFVDDVMLPVPPPKMTVKVNNKNKTVDLINEGEINVIKSPGLTDVSFEVLLPNSFYPFAFYEKHMLSSFMSRIFGGTPEIEYAKEYVKRFERLKAQKTPFRLIVSRMSPSYEFLGDLNMLVTLEEYSINESADNAFDWQVPLSFKEYRPYETKELTEQKNEKGEKVLVVKSSRPNMKEMPKAYKTTQEMTIWEICKQATDGKLDWRAIMALNKIGQPPAENLPKGMDVRLV